MRWRGRANQSRRLILAHYKPQNWPVLRKSPVAASPYLKINFDDTTGANLCDFVERWHVNGGGVDTIWIDAD